MKIIVLFLSAILLSASVSAQDCNCLTEFDFVRSYMERNHPGLNSGTKKTTAYKKGVRSLRNKIRKLQPREECNLYLDEYLLLLKDHHIFLRPAIPLVKKADVNSVSSMDSFYRSATYQASPKRSVDTIALMEQLGNTSPTAIEGIYKDGSGNLVAFVQEPQDAWTYKGIVIRSVSKLFPVGTVRYELMPRSKERAWIRVLMQDHQHRVYMAVTAGSAGLASVGLKRFASAAGEERKIPYAFRQLNDSTLYLRISSFDGSLYAELQKFYESVETKLGTTPFWIIDIRDNGGGAESNYAFLKKYIYSGPVTYGSADIWVSPDNIRRYEELLDEQLQHKDQYSRQSIDRTEKLLSLMKAAPPYQFLSLGEATTVTPDSVLRNPKKIALLMNRGCASSAEGFIAFAQQSSKVITMGENSGGYVGYGDILTAKTPCYGYGLGNTMLRFTRLYPYEFIGFTPQVKLDPAKDWIAEAIKRLN